MYNNIILVDRYITRKNIWPHSIVLLYVWSQWAENCFVGETEPRIELGSICNTHYGALFTVEASGKGDLETTHPASILLRCCQTSSLSFLSTYNDTDRLFWCFFPMFFFSSLISTCRTQYIFHLFVSFGENFLNWIIVYGFRSLWPNHVLIFIYKGRRNVYYYWLYQSILH